MFNKDMHYFIAEPIYNFHGRLYAIEVLTRFTDFFTSDERELFFLNLSCNEKLAIFIEQIHALSSHKDYLLSNGILCSVNIDHETFFNLLNYKELMEKVISHSFLRIELHESTQVSTIRSIKEYFSNHDYPIPNDFFWSDDFTRSRFTPEIYLLWGEIIKIIKIDRSLLLNSDFIELKLLIELIKSRGCKVIVEGTETFETAQAAFKIGADFVQGFLFPNKEISNIKSIPLTVPFEV
jgi:EAL domain-containing protein (putative c-di-GMP-specific phosphodiesterase class I)